MTWAIVILFALLAVAVMLLILARNRYKAEQARREIAERVGRLAIADNESLLKYMADNQALKGVQDDDYIEYKTADDKHNVIADILDRVYGLRDK